MFDINSRTKILSETTKTVHDFFDQLVLNDYLKEAEPHRSIVYLGLRNAYVLQLLNALEIEIDSPSSVILKLILDRGLKKYHYYVLYYSLVVHLWLDQTEHMKSVLLTLLNNKAKKECNLKDNDTLGQLLTKLEKKIRVDNFKKLVNPDFRNVLGHGKWWVQRENFCYEDEDKKIHFLEKEEFLYRQAEFSALTATFLKALKEYFVMP